MVFLRDEGSVFDAPLDMVWRFVSSRELHAAAHRHRRVRRRRLPGNSGRYSWEQPFDGRSVRFTMRWTAFPPVGIAYDVLEGPFAGSRFFLYYRPKGSRTGVSVAGEFVSPTLAAEQVPAAVDRFFAKEFEQDQAGLRAARQAGPPGTRDRRSRRGPPARAGRNARGRRAVPGGVRASSSRRGRGGGPRRTP